MNHVKPNIFISACIEHSPVRFDATMISSQVVKDLKPYVNFIKVCPEVAIGMPSPRETIRLIQDNDSVKLVSSNEGHDYTEDMLSFSRKYTSNLISKDIDGFILKAKSPTCGTDKIKVYKGIGKSQPLSTVPNGLFAQEIVDSFELYPIESERRLSNFNIREHFYIRIFTLARFRFVENTPIKHLVDFHSKHKYLFMGFNQLTMKKMGNVVANHQKLPKEVVYENYKSLLFKLLSKPSSREKRINVLTHIYGYFKDSLTIDEKNYYFETQNDYLNGHVPYSSPLRVLKSFVIRFQEKYLIDQYVFDPYPKQLITQLDSGKTL